MSKNGQNPFDEIYATDVMVLGVGCILYTDEGFGVRVVEKMEALYEFSDNVLLVDGGVLGINLLGVISKPDHLIVVDAIRNKGKPGDLYRLAGDQIPQRIRAKNSLHQVDFLEALTLCQALDKVPETVIIGIGARKAQCQLECHSGRDPVGWWRRRCLARRTTSLQSDAVGHGLSSPCRGRPGPKHPGGSVDWWRRKRKCH